MTINTNTAAPVAVATDLGALAIAPARVTDLLAGVALRPDPATPTAGVQRPPRSPRARLDVGTGWLQYDGDCDDDDDCAPFDVPGAVLVGDVAVVRVDGPLVSGRHWWLQSYDEVADAWAACHAHASVRSVMLYIDSPGGTIAGCFDAVRAMRKTAAASGKRTVAYTGDMACSGAYALASVCGEIVVGDTADVGSVGVIWPMVSYAGALAQDGVDVRVVTAGAEKADGHPMAPITDEAVARRQHVVDMTAQIFRSEVSIGRGDKGLTVEALVALEAGVRMGHEAVGAGLADRVAALPDVVAGMQSSAPMMITASAATHTASAASAARANVTSNVSTTKLTQHTQHRITTMDLSSMAARLAAITGKTDASDIVARVESLTLQADAANARADAAEAKLAAQVKRAESEAFERAISEGSAAGKLTPAMAARLREKHAAGKLDAAELGADLAAMPVVVSREPAANQPQVVDTAGMPGATSSANVQALASRDYADLTPDERNVLANEAPELHTQLRQRWVDAGRPQSQSSKR